MQVCRVKGAVGRWVVAGVPWEGLLPSWLAWVRRRVSFWLLRVPKWARSSLDLLCLYELVYFPGRGMWVDWVRLCLSLYRGLLGRASFG